VITPQNIRPENSLYVIGAAIIFVMKKTEAKEINPEIIYKDFCLAYPIKISYSYFLYALDWLFLIDFISLGDNKNQIKKCF
jgi:hypothetical protein